MFDYLWRLWTRTRCWFGLHLWYDLTPTKIQVERFERLFPVLAKEVDFGPHGVPMHDRTCIYCTDVDPALMNLLNEAESAGLPNGR